MCAKSFAVAEHPQMHGQAGAVARGTIPRRLQLRVHVTEDVILGARCGSAVRRPWSHLRCATGLIHGHVAGTVEAAAPLSSFLIDSLPSFNTSPSVSPPSVLRSPSLLRLLLQFGPSTQLQSLSACLPHLLSLLPWAPCSSLHAAYASRYSSDAVALC